MIHLTVCLQQIHDPDLDTASLMLLLLQQMLLLELCLLLQQMLLVVLHVLLWMIWVQRASLQLLLYARILI